LNTGGADVKDPFHMQKTWGAFDMLVSITAAAVTRAAKALMPWKALCGCCDAVAVVGVLVWMYLWNGSE